MKSFKEILFKSLTYFAAIFSILALFGIISTLFIEGLPMFKEVSFREFFLSTKWYPTNEHQSFGALALLIGSVTVTLGALIIAIPIGLGSAIYLSEIAGSRTKEIVKPMIELLAGIPSVVYGLFGMAFLAPFLIRTLGIDSGLNIFTASIVLGIMIIPIISSMSEDALSTVPRALREASYGLGATKWETITRVVVPAAKTGIMGSFVLGFGRAIGETMVVIMVAGGAAQIPSSIFDPVRPLTTSIAVEMAETVLGSIHFHSLFALAIMLFIITFITNLFTELFLFKKVK
jgi:phosphate transport system permease protein